MQCIVAEGEKRAVYELKEKSVQCIELKEKSVQCIELKEKACSVLS